MIIISEVLKDAIDLHTKETGHRSNVVYLETGRVRCNICDKLLLWEPCVFNDTIRREIKT